MSHSTRSVSPLLFGSGFCALVYQTAWLRQFRLIFGASTLATAAVLAIFMAGLGLGSAFLGKRADAHPHPLALYGDLELLIAVAAALSPVLLWIVAKVYFATGGSVSLGLFPATILRLLLALVVLGLPTFLMGGTLPAAARAVETGDALEHDSARRKVAVLYAANTLGAVAGTLLATFYALEHFGNRGTLLLAVVVNLGVAFVARRSGRDVTVATALPSSVPSNVPSGAVAPRRILIASAIVGFAFLLMELVWYRMLAPLLGGSTFTFGLILAIALFGIGLGGAAYAFRPESRRATVGGFALTCSLEAVAIAIPFALGDRLAIVASLFRSLGAIGFQGHVFGWTVITLIVVFPAAFIAGVQFPLLIALLGSGEVEVGDHVGRAYAWNTAGAIVGSLAGGFGLLPLLTAPGTWRVVIVLLALLGLAAMLVARKAQPVTAMTSAIPAVVAVALTFALGPTAVWRHSGIGAGRASSPDSPNKTRSWMNGNRRSLVWDADGRESSVALSDGNEFGFIVNGKADGTARSDAGTQVMAGLVGAALHPHAQRALVIGLGTGSTAGWLGAQPSMQRVDVVELEPAVLGVARACSSVNHDVLHNPKVRIRIADAREVLLASREAYDIVFSEPSNPYRAGIASLFTEEFYRASAARLAPGGIFLQWVQAYDVDAQTIRTIYATIGSAFPNVETWTTDDGDLLLVGTRQPIVYDADALRRRLAEPALLTPMSHVWRVETLEGFLSHFLAGTAFARAMAQDEPLNTDDRTLIEFGFARALGAHRFDLNEIVSAAGVLHVNRPNIVRGTVAWDAVTANRATITYISLPAPAASPEDAVRHRAMVEYAAGHLPEALAAWRGHPMAPINSGELMMLAECNADAGVETAAVYAEQLRNAEATDADLVLARLRFQQHRPADAAAMLERALLNARHDPWATIDAMGRSLDLVRALATVRALSPALTESLARPFAAGLWEDARRWYLATMLRDFEACSPRTIRALRALEPWPPWQLEFLKVRRDCYATVFMDDLRSRAQDDLDAYAAAEPAPLLTTR